MPRVSVVIPTYNRSKLVRKAIESVLKQTYRDFEIIVVDDGSTDNTKEVIDSFGNQVRYLYQENRGLSDARNPGIKAAQGELIAFIDSDDLWLPQKLQLQVELYDYRPNLGFIYTDYQFINFEGVPLPKPPIFASNPPRKGRILEYLLLLDFIPPSAVMIHRDRFDSVGMFDPDLKCGTDDWDLLLRLSKVSEVSYVEDACTVIRLHDGNWAPSDLAMGTIQVLVRHLQKTDTKVALGDKWLSVYYDRYLTIADYYYNRGEMRNALNYYLEAIKVSPLRLFDGRLTALILKTMLGNRALNMARTVRNAISRP